MAGFSSFVVFHFCHAGTFSENSSMLFFSGGLCVFVFSQGSDKSKYKIPQVNTMPKGKCSIRSKACCAIYLLNTNTDMRSFKNSAFQTIKSHSSFIIVKYLSWKHLRGGSERVYSSML